MHVGKSVSNTPISQYFGFIFSALIVSIIWLLSISGGLVFFDGLCYNTAMTYRWYQPQRPPSVLLVKINPQSYPLNDSLLCKALENIQQHKPRVVAFNFIPENASPTFYQTAAKFGNVIFGRPIFLNPLDEEKSRLADLPLSLTAQNFPVGIVALATPVNGIHQKQRIALQIQNNAFLSLEALIMQKFMSGSAGSSVLPSSEAFLVNFKGPNYGLPLVDLERVLADDMLTEMVRDKSVLIGYDANLATQGIYTPVTNRHIPISLLEFEGYAVDTLQSGQAITTLNIWLKLILFLFCALMSLLIYQQLEVFHSTWITILLLAAYILMSLLLINYFHIWLPLGELLILQTVLFVILLRNKSRLTELAFTKLLVDTNNKLKNKYWPVGFYQSANYWDQVVVMVIQVLELERLIFLERVEDEIKVKEIKSFRCSLTDIDEKRRDYRREPYLSAIQKSEPLRLNYHYLTKTSDDEEQYMCALKFAGEIVGFWAFGIKPKIVQETKNFFNIVQDYGDMIGELIYHHRVLQKKQAEKSLGQLLTRERTEQAYQALSNTIAVLERQMISLGSLLNDLTIAAIVYDLFGRVLEINTNMRTILESQQIKPYDVTALDLLSQITGCNLSEARHYMRYVITERSDISIPVTVGLSRYVLKIKPLRTDEKFKISDLHFPAPFGLSGIIYELIDSTSIYQLQHLKNELSERLTIQVRNHLAAVHMSIALLEDPDMTSTERKEIADVAEQKVNLAVSTIEECEVYLTAMESRESPISCFPLDALPILEAAVQSTQADLELANLTLQKDFPEIANAVMANAEKLVELFKSIMSVLIEDAVQDSRISIKVMELEHGTAYHFSNVGFGVPNERLQYYLTSEDVSISKHFSTIKRASKSVQSWNGSLKAESKVGDGIHFNLTLNRFF